MKRILVAIGSAALVITLAGCSASSGSASRSDSSGTSSVGRAPVPGAAAPGVKGLESVKDAPGSRSVVTTGTIELTVKDPSRVADSAARIVGSAGGRVDGRTEHAAEKGGSSSRGADGSATLTLRIPSARLDATVSSLSKLGTVENISIASDDVTATSKDLDARITALRTSVDRLVDLMSRASTTADLITIESALAERQSSLESLETQQRSLADQVDLATITLNLGSVADKPATVPSTFASGLSVGFGGLVSFVGGALVVLGVVLPWMILSAIIVCLVFLVLRFRRHILRVRLATNPGSPS